MTDDATPETPAVAPTAALHFDPVPAVARMLGLPAGAVGAVVALLDEGNTVPFIARYRKELTGALDDTQLRTLEERLTYLRELEARRTAILDSIREQGKLDAALEARIMAADSKGRLEDIYLPFKPKRRTKAEIAKEAGLEPLADMLLADAKSDPAAVAARFVDAKKNVADANAALEGARAILVERFAEDADLIGSLREEVWSAGRLTAKVREDKKEAGAKFADYFDFSEDLSKAPSHRILALFRAQKEEVIDIAIESENKTTASPNICLLERMCVSREPTPQASLLVAKFIPGFSAVATAMAGLIGTRWRVFTLFDSLGALLWAGAAVALGAIFSDAVRDILDVLETLGKAGLLVIAGGFATAILLKLRQRRRFYRQLRMDRITVDELRTLLDEGRAPSVLDVRAISSQQRDGRIPGATAVDSRNLHQAILAIEPAGEVVVYCACPNEASAALIAKQLIQLGFSRVRPLQGGIDAWIAAGYVVDH